MKRFGILIFTLAWTLGLAAIVSADNPALYYVAVNGNDAYDGLSPDTPFKTIAHALEHTDGTAEIPVIINIAEGTYSATTNGEQLPLVLKSSVVYFQRWRSVLLGCNI